ncbi:hypothetical protein Drorol1_Dr00016031 [Drosera rotundifolia]
MTTSIDPPPPPPPTVPSSSATTTATPDAPTQDLSSSTTTTAMEPPSNSTTPMPPPPPPPQNPNQSDNKIPTPIPIPYTIPPWSDAPAHPFYLEVLKDGTIIDQLDVAEKGAYMFGRVESCDFVLEHPTISRFHAVLQFKGSGEAYLYDLGSTHGTSINKKQVKPKIYVELHVGDIVRFGLSSRLYIFEGPEELMPPEKDLTSIRYSNLQQEKRDREASLGRAKEEAALADGISWGMGEDAIEEAEDDTEEITWQTYKGELTEKQDKTRTKVLKRLEKIAHMKKEIDAIRAKDIAQGGLTQGQQTQIARNEQRISQLMEELDNLEETLNDSIQESVGARSGKSSRARGKEAAEEDDDIMSDDDEFYDRTKKKPSVNKTGIVQTVETAESLLDKKDSIMKEMEEKQKALLDEKNKITEPQIEAESGDALDAYMTGLSSQLVLDRTRKLQEELSTLQTELNRVLYLLKLADPTGEAAKKRETAAQQLVFKEPETSSGSNANSDNGRKATAEETKASVSKKSHKPSNSSAVVEVQPDATAEVVKVPEVTEESIVAYTTNDNTVVANTTDNNAVVYNPIKPQWLGAVEDEKKEESRRSESRGDEHASDGFVDYKDRNKILANSESDGGLENAAPGLIIRKKKQVKKSDIQGSEQVKTSSSGAEMAAEDAIALLLKHKRGYYDLDEEAMLNGEGSSNQDEPGQDNKKPRRVLGPEKPSFWQKNPVFESWAPPEGQSGDGRTSLNDQLGY